MLVAKSKTTGTHLHCKFCNKRIHEEYCYFIINNSKKYLAFHEECIIKLGNNINKCLIESNLNPDYLKTLKRLGKMLQ